MLSLELTSNRMSPLGRSLVTDSELLSLDQILAEIEAVDPESVAQLAAMLLAPEKLSVAGIGTNEERFRAATARWRRTSPRPRPRDASPAACPGLGRGRSAVSGARRASFPHRESSVPRRTLSGAGARNRAAS